MIITGLRVTKTDLGVAKTDLRVAKTDLQAKRSAIHTFAWKRGETTANASELMAFNGLIAEALAKGAIGLIG
ncbi:hypothetical protein A6770_07510 [Nostoc minutum NIES-26]|uniref:Uncharacterized protein n=1 Tax=Nostoc minutum NIES-26 TaxID=1844469 RepID=A0A367S1N3_9NOSO|nr:hypothetical protein A6770_07510 [Nostoc minutum NIES-26]